MNAQELLAILNPFPITFPERPLERAWYHMGRAIVILARRVLYRTDVHALAPVPSGPKILAANHPCTIDPFLLTTLVPEQITTLIIDTLFKVPVVGTSLRMSGQIRVSAGQGRAALDQGIRFLQEGRTLGIFPEGAISPSSGGLAHAHTGVIRLAAATGAPVVPIGIALERNKLRYVQSVVDGKSEVGTWYLNGAYAVTIGEPLCFNGNPEDRAFVRAATDALMSKISELSAQSARRLAEKRLAEMPTLVELLYRWMPFFSTEAL